MENFGDVESRGYYANIWELTAIWLVRFLLRRSKLQAIQFFRLERLTHSRFSRSIIQCDFDSVGVRESVSVQLVRVIFFFLQEKMERCFEARYNILSTTIFSLCFKKSIVMLVSI